MAKNKISEFSSTAADNTDITNINIAEGCSPANLNNSIRSLMALLKDQQTGSSGDPFTVAGTLVSSGTVDITGAFKLDGTAGTSGQVLSSAGGANTPTWSTLGTMASQNSTSVAITGGTITGITDLTVADGGTGASSITANSVILGNGTSALSGNLVAPSTSGNVLTSNGTTWQSTALPQATITRATAQATTSGSNIDFTSIPSWVKRITIAFAGVSTNGNNFLVQIGSGSITSTGYISTSNQVANDSTSTGGNSSTSGFVVTNRSASGTTSGLMTLINITGNQWVSSHSIKQSTTYISAGGGDVSLSGTLDRLRITTGSAEVFDAGSVNILYE